jgi:hypothetical protein
MITSIPFSYVKGERGELEFLKGWTVEWGQGQNQNNNRKPMG